MGVVGSDEDFGDFAAPVAFGVDMPGCIDRMDVEIRIEIPNQIAVRVGEHDLDAARGQFCKHVPKPNLVLLGEGVAGVGGELAGDAEGVVGRIEVDEIVAGFGAFEDIFKADGFDAGGFEGFGAGAKEIGIVDAGVFVSTHGDVEVAFGVFAV